MRERGRGFLPRFDRRAVVDRSTDYQSAAARASKANERATVDRETTGRTLVTVRDSIGDGDRRGEGTLVTVRDSIGDGDRRGEGTLVTRSSHSGLFTSDDSSHGLTSLTDLSDLFDRPL